MAGYWRKRAEKEFFEKVQYASIELPTEVVGGESFETGAAAFKRARELLPDDPHFTKATADPETDAEEEDTTTLSDNAGNIKSRQDEAETGGSDEQRSLTDW